MSVAASPPASADPVSTLSVALGNYPHAQSIRAAAAGGPAFEFAAVSPISRAFGPMVRELRYDISEMALMTYLQAKAFGKPLTLLPVTVAARSQEAALLYRATDAAIGGPADLRGKRVGVRAYSQTTGVWIRGVLADDYGVACEDIGWVTSEGAHVSEYVDPPWVERAAPGRDPLAMLRDGQVDAVILGNDLPDDPGLRTVFADPDAAAARFRARHGFMPVNHLVVARAALLSQGPNAVTSFVRSLLAGYRGRADLLVGCAALEPVVELALRYMTEQRLLPRPLTMNEVWEGLSRPLRSVTVEP